MELDETMYDRVFDINVKGTYLVDQAVLRYMIPLRRGKIVNMSSMSGKIAYPTNVAYSGFEVCRNRTYAGYCKIGCGIQY